MPDGPKVLDDKIITGDFRDANEKERVLSSHEIGEMIMQELRARRADDVTQGNADAPWSTMQAH